MIHHFRKFTLIILFCFTYHSPQAYSFEHSPVDTILLKNNPFAEEILAQLKVDDLESYDISAYLAGDTLFLPVIEIFSFLKIRCEYDDNILKLTGVYINEDNKYSIDLIESRIKLDDKVFHVSRSDFYLTETELFLKDRIFSEIFGLNFTLNFHTLEIFLKTNHRLPFVLLQERELARKQLRSKYFYTGGIVENFIKSNRPIVGGLMLDWSFNHYQFSFRNYNYSYSLNLGAEIFGGDFDAAINGQSNSKMIWKNNPWRWRFVSDDRYLFRQGLIGDVFTHTGQIMNIHGLQITNSPVPYRKSFGTHQIFDRIKPNSDIELYVNNQFVSYKRSDSNGYYRFEVPLSYGSNYITLKSYRDYEEGKSYERLIQIPSSFLPRGEFEYTLTAGRLKYLDWKKTSELLFNYGMSPHITFGGGVQYIDDRRISRFTPFLQLLIRFGDNLITSGEYIYKNKATGKVNLFLHSQIGAELSYTKFAVNQLFNGAKYSEEKNFSLQLPFKKDNISFGLRFNLREVSYQNNYRFMNCLGSLYLYLLGIYSSFNTNKAWSRIEGNYKSQILMSSLLNSFNIFRNILFQSQIDIDHYKRKVNFVRANFYRNIFNGLWLDFSMYRDFISKITGFSLNCRWDLPFSQINSRVESYQGHYTFYQNARGAIGYDATTDNLLTDNRIWVRRGAITIHPFLDENNNGSLDVNEIELPVKMKADISGGKGIYSSNNNYFRVVDLEPYDTCYVQIDQTSFDNPLLKLKYNKFSFVADPNQFKKIAVPIYTTGEVSGKIFKESRMGIKGLSGIKVNFQSSDGIYKTEAKSFSSGEYFVESLLPGVYKAFIDSAFLRKLSLSSEPDTLFFEIKSMQDGDIVEDLNFVLRERIIAKLDKTSNILDSLKISETIIIPTILLDTLKSTKPKLKLKVLNRINFRYSSTSLDSMITKFLDTLVVYLKGKNNILVKIEGHTDNWGTAKQNQRISQMRASRIRDYLLNKGADARILKTIAFGDRRPIASNATAESRARNRRVEIIIEVRK